MKMWERLKELFTKKCEGGWRYYEWDARLHSALIHRAEQEQRPAEDMQAELLATGLEQRQLYIMDNANEYINSVFVAWGLAGLLMLVLVLLAFLRKRRLVKERVAILIIVAVMLLALLALTVNIE